MTTPLAILAFFAIALGAIGTPAWPWFRAFLNSRAADVDLHAFAELAWLMLLLSSCVIVVVGIGAAGGFTVTNRPPPRSRTRSKSLSPGSGPSLRDKSLY